MLSQARGPNSGPRTFWHTASAPYSLSVLYHLNVIKVPKITRAHRPAATSASLTSKPAGHPPTALVPVPYCPKAPGANTSTHHCEFNTGIKFSNACQSLSTAAAAECCQSKRYPGAVINSPRFCTHYATSAAVLLTLNKLHHIE